MPRRETKRMKFATIAIHAGQEPDPTTGAVSVPIYQTSTYAQEGIDKLLRKFGLEFTYVDAREAQNLDDAARAETRMAFIETPTNPVMSLVDIAAVAEITKRRGIRLVVDNTFMSPYFQRPLELGAD